MVYDQQDGRLGCPIPHHAHDRAESPSLQSESDGDHLRVRDVRRGLRSSGLPQQAAGQGRLDCADPLGQRPCDPARLVPLVTQRVGRHAHLGHLALGPGTLQLGTFRLADSCLEPRRQRGSVPARIVPLGAQRVGHLLDRVQPPRRCLEALARGLQLRTKCVDACVARRQCSG